jgi:hypothetical protein
MVTEREIAKIDICKFIVTLIYETLGPLLLPPDSLIKSIRLLEVPTVSICKYLILTLNCLKELVIIQSPQAISFIPSSTYLNKI